MRIFGGNKNKEKSVLVFYIGSSFVGAVLFRAGRSGIPKIIMSLREPITLQKTLDVEKFLSSTLKSLEILVNRVHAASLGAPDDIFCVLSSLWYVSQTRIIKLEKNTPFLFTEKLAMDLIQKEKDLFEEDHSEKYSHSGMKARLIELKNIKTMINGYETKDPLNQKGKDLEMTVFISMCGEQILGEIEKVVGKHFNFKEMKFSSFGFASFSVVRDIYAHSDDFLLIDIGGEVTDISMVKKNVLRESVSFPLGLNFMIRRVASVLKVSLGEAKSLISLFKDGHAEESVEKKLSPIIDKSKTEWLTKFQESLSNISNDISIPATIYLIVEKEMADFFSDIIKNEQFNQYTLTESKFKIIFLGAEVFHGMAVFEGDVLPDPLMIINCIFANRFLIRNV